MKVILEINFYVDNEKAQADNSQSEAMSIDQGNHVMLLHMMWKEKQWAFNCVLCDCACNNVFLAGLPTICTL